MYNVLLFENKVDGEEDVVHKVRIENEVVLWHGVSASLESPTHRGEILMSQGGSNDIDLTAIYGLRWPVESPQSSSGSNAPAV